MQRNSILFILFFLLLMRQATTYAMGVEQKNYSNIVRLYPIVFESVNYSEKENDKFKFKIFSQENKKVNLKGISFTDDKIFKIITEDFIIDTNKTVTVILNSEEKDNEDARILHSKHKGLTATTDQIVVEYNSIILGFICWSDKKPSKAEINDFQKFYNRDFFSGDKISDCHSSEKQKGINVEKPINVKSAKKTLFEGIFNNNNTNINKTEIRISELLPNPEGSDTGNEWIEISNQSDKSISLLGYTISNKKNKSFPIDEYEKLLPPKSVILIKPPKGFTLNNAEEKIILFDNYGEAIDAVEYKKAENGKSLVFLTIIDEETSEPQEISLWTKKMTPGKFNPTLQTISGKIDQELTEINALTFFVILRTNEGSTKKILLDEEIIEAGLAKTILNKGENVKIYYSMENNDNEYLQAFHFEIIEKKMAEKTALLISIMVILIISIITAIVVYKKRLSLKKNSIILKKTL